MLDAPKPVEIFLSYAPEDESLCSELVKHLSLMKYEGLITTWHNRQIVAGTDWTKEMDQRLSTAHVILLLVSADFIASKYGDGAEMQRAMQRHEEGAARVIPILLRPYDWQSASFGRLAALPSNGKPVTNWRNRDEAFMDIAQYIRAALPGGVHKSVSMPSTTSAHHVSITDRKNVGTLLCTSHLHMGPVYSLAWSANGAYLASAGANKTVIVRNCSLHQEAPLPSNYTREVFALSWSPDSTALAVGGKEGFIDIWEIASQRKKLTYQGHLQASSRIFLKADRWILSLAWSPDGLSLASGSADITAHVWNTSTGECYYVYNGHHLKISVPESHVAASISSLAWSPDGKRLATASLPIDDEMERSLSFKFLNTLPGINWLIQQLRKYFTIHVWDAYTGNNVVTYAQHTNGVTSLAWSPDGTYLASASKDTTVHIWDPTYQITACYTQGAIYRGHSHQVKAVVWSPDGTVVASAGNDGTVQVWKPRTGEHVYTYRGHSKCVRALAWSPDGNVIASAGDEGVLHLWQAPPQV